MLGLALRMAFVALGLYLAAHFVPGVHIHGTRSLIFATLVLAVINAVIRPIVVILTLPLTLITLGLFLFVINALLFLILPYAVHGVSVAGFGAAFFGSLVVGVTSFIGNAFVGSQGGYDRWH